MHGAGVPGTLLLIPHLKLFCCYRHYTAEKETVDENA